MLEDIMLLKHQYEDAVNEIRHKYENDISLYIRQLNRECAEKTGGIMFTSVNVDVLCTTPFSCELPSSVVGRVTIDLNTD